MECNYISVYIQNEWHFPLHLATPERDSQCDSVYNFVLEERNHSIIVNGIECVTLGHGLEGDVVGHPFFGTQRVVEELRKMRGFSEGCVELFPSMCGGKSMIRDEKTGLVCGFVEGVGDALCGKCEM